MYGGHLKQNTPLKRKTPLRAKKGFSLTRKEKGVRNSLLKRRSRALSARKKVLSPQAELDRIFSLIVRRSEADSQGMVKCSTCPKVLHWSKMQCGHFRKRAHTATRYYRGNCAVQCEECNCYTEDGNYSKLASYLENKYGYGHVAFLGRLSAHITHDFPYEDKIQEFSLQLKRLEELQDKEIQY